MQGSSNKKHSFWAFLLLGLASHTLLGNFVDRADFFFLLICYFLCFASWFGMWKNSPVENQKFLLILIIAGVGLRSIWFFSPPSFSDDYQRFIWDGNLIHNNISPYSYKPVEIIRKGILESDQNVEKIVQEMNSPQYFSIYPPINQAFFWISTFSGVQDVGSSILILRLLFLGVELIGLFFILKILNGLGMAGKQFQLFWLNPMVIMEGVGNLHFEVIAVSFLAMGLFYLLKEKPMSSALGWALGIGVKLNPLILLPMSYGWLGLKRSLTFTILIFVITVICLLPILPDLPQFLSSIDLYFHKFEFNASIYYVQRELGFLIKGYNTIGTIGTLNPVFFMLFWGLISWWAFQRKDFHRLLLGSVLIYSVYLALATTVHPWYVIPLLLFGMFSRLWFPFLWSFLAIFSYYAYSQHPIKENAWFLLLEYLPVYFFAIYEIRKKLRSHESG